MTRKLEERIAGALVANCCWGAVAGIHDRLIRQNQQLLMYRAQNLLKRAAPEVGPANTPGKKRVPSKELPRFGASFHLWLGSQIKRDAPRRVSRRMQDIGFETAPAERVALAQEFIDASRIWSSHTDPGGLHIQMTIKLHVVAMHEHRRAGGLLHFAQTAYMVDVGVRAHNGLDGQRMLGQQLQNPPGFVARIDYQRFARFGIADDRTIALQHTDWD